MPPNHIAQQLADVGAALLAPADLRGLLGFDDCEWASFAAHWEHLAADPYAAELGTRRLRRYGHFAFRPAERTFDPVACRAFIQPENSNPLYIDTDRHFESLTDGFAKDQLLQRILALLGDVATPLDDASTWDAKVTPFRVLASTGDAGQPTPEGMHRDGVTLVTSLLIGRDNAVGGRSIVTDMAGEPILATTLADPGTLLLGDDRRTLHGVSPIRPRDPSRPARRDVLVITFAPSA
ncbi:2OG-Fe dioxygenase family protein [Mycobacterium sp. 3519A]|uniref:2OG-Fe dioxygenase family protein n=1 Tax=Mycobacterium sp. 3519A TaxID=2057184 RepID=UPI000C7D3221|nr:2OG-Fe dioxygenase family protein [Mycobacterium sp. 3519A]